MYGNAQEQEYFWRHITEWFHNEMGLGEYHSKHECTTKLNDQNNHKVQQGVQKLDAPKKKREK